MRYTVKFVCGFVETCQHCGQEIEPTACEGERRVTVDLEDKPTMGLLRFAANNPRCPICKEYMVINDYWESN